MKISRIRLVSVLVVLLISLAIVHCSVSTRERCHACMRDFLVGASYMTFWGTGMDIDWSSGAVYWPLLGNYSSNNITVADQHIEWALESGIDFFYLDYGWGNDSERKLMEDATKYGLLEAEGMKNFSFCIFYFPHNVVNDTSSVVNGTALREHFSHINETYLNKSSYLQLDNRSVIFLADFPKYLNKNLSPIEINSLFHDLKEDYTLYLIPAFWRGQPDDANNVLNDPRRVYDAVTLWGSTTIIEFNETISYSDYINKTRNNFRTWSNIAEGFGVDFVPLICPGYNNTIYYNLGKTDDWWATVTRDPEGFSEVCQLAKNYSSPPHNMVLLFTWNDFKEATCIEPTTDYGFTYLNITAEEFLTPMPVGGIWIPTNKLELLAPYIALTILLAVAVTIVVYVRKRKRDTEINS